jgi:hypothetical protein
MQTPWCKSLLLQHPRIASPVAFKAQDGQALRLKSHYVDHSTQHELRRLNLIAFSG